MKANVPVVVIGGSLNSLGVVRSLANDVEEIYVISTTRLCPGAWSRYCRKLIHVKSLEGRPLIDALKKFASQHPERAVLILTDDRAVDALSIHRDEIEPLFRLRLPSKEVVQFLADKALFHQFAEKNDLPVPKSIVIKDKHDFALLKNLMMPLVLKPANKSMVLNGRVARVERVETYEQACSVAKSMLKSVDDLIAQEWIDGPDRNIFFTLFTCDSKSNVKAIFSGQKIVCNPPGVGNTAVCVAAVERKDELEQITRKFIQIVNYTGLGSMEFKLDDRTSRFLIVEPTVGRTDWQEEIATLCGVNIPLAAYQSETGKNSETPSAQKIRPDYHQIAWCSAIRHKPPRGGLRPGTKIRGGYFLLKDPMPSFYYYGYERFAGRAISLVRKLINGKMNDNR